MAGMAAEAVLKKISQGHLECPICCCRFIKPKILNCLHSFCKDCLEKMAQHQPDEEVIACPVCRRQTVVSETGIAGLSNNFSLMALVDEVTQQEELVKSQRSEIICEECDEAEEATFRCLECREYLCDFCQNSHKRSKKTKNHETTTIHDLRSGTATFKSRLWNEVPTCEKHSSQDLIFYCETCMALICAACTALDHRAPDHKFCDIAAAIHLCKENVTELITKAEQHLTEFTAAKEKAHKSHNNHKTMVMAKHNIITQKADIVVARIRKNECLLKKKVTQICQKQDKQFEEVLAQHGENVDETESALERVKNMMAHITDYDLLKLQQNLLQNLKDATQRDIPSNVWGLTPEDFQQCEQFSPAELDILIIAEKPLTAQEQAKFMKTGVRVVRGQDWDWGNQDGYPPGEGIITEGLNREGWVRVLWARRSSGNIGLNYRMGAEEKFDLQLAAQKIFQTDQTEYF